MGDDQAMRWIAFVVALLIAVPPAAATKRTDQLLWDCQGQNQAPMIGVSACVGFISGFIDAFAIIEGMSEEKVRFFCLPKRGISNDQAVRVFVKWAIEHPGDLHYPARTILMLAFRSTFPCP